MTGADAVTWSAATTVFGHCHCCLTETIYFCQAAAIYIYIYIYQATIIFSSLPTSACESGEADTVRAKLQAAASG